MIRSLPSWATADVAIPRNPITNAAVNRLTAFLISIAPRVRIFKTVLNRRSSTPGFTQPAPQRCQVALEVYDHLRGRLAYLVLVMLAHRPVVAGLGQSR